jgi:predicted HNH restriction endonuclease
MKQCSQCKEEKEESSFYRNAKHGYFPYCKACAKIKYAKAHYEDNKDLYKGRSKQNNLNYRNKFIKYKSTLSCNVCGESRYWCIDFHHVKPDEKIDTICNIVRLNSSERLEQELKKCIPLCKNCHADLHHRERKPSSSKLS